MSDLGGLSRCAGSMGVPGLADALQEPLLFCELMVFGRWAAWCSKRGWGRRGRGTGRELAPF